MIGVVKIPEENIEIEISEIQSREHYSKAIAKCESTEEIFMVDFLYHIHKLNSDDTFSFDELNEYFDDLDVDVVEKIFDKYNNMRFKVDDLSEVECPHCKFKETYQFDDLPGFFPNEWFGIR